MLSPDGMLRRSCHGVVPIPGRFEEWQRDLLTRPADLAALVAAHGSPVNLIRPDVLPRRADALVAAAAALGVETSIRFARKANKAMALVDAAVDGGHGVDVASERELAQCLDRGVPADRIIVTAAVKPRALLERALTAGVVVSLDNADEVALLRRVAARRAPGTPSAQVALRVAPPPGLTRAPSRFGMPVAEIAALLADTATWDHLALRGLHVHLAGYDAGERARMLAVLLDLVETARDLDHDPEFVDLGGGVPIRYLDDPAPWQAFWRRHREALLGRGAPLTWGGHGLGLRPDPAADGGVAGSPDVYPLWQDSVGADWLSALLRTPGADGVAVGERCRRLGVRLQLEPGRALLDGAGLTVARVEFRKRADDGSWLVGLAMNRTQCRSAAADFLLDPVLVRTGERDPVADRVDEGHLVGAYCIEAELLTWRRLVFPDGVAVGDLVVFVNTAGYLMHILESASHQIPLARNLVPGRAGWQLDAIDAP